MSNRNSRVLYVLLTFFAALFVAGAPSFAAPASTPCDPEYYKSLKAKAWMEAQREITQNQNLIFKPDSVLEYTCFDKHMAELADHAKDMFSENPRWGGAAVDMAGSLNTLVHLPLYTYIQANFGHDLLGGRLKDEDYSVPAALTPGSYNCDMMNRVWMEAKCWDFAREDESGEDGFYTLEDYASGEDKRFLPLRCTSPLTNTGENKWQESMDEAFNAPSWTQDVVNPYISEVSNLTAGVDCKNSMPVPTGIRVATQAGTTFEEKVCIMPGCHYNAATGSCIP